MSEPTYPDTKGHFGIYGGRYVGETLMPALLELEAAYRELALTPRFRASFTDLLRDYAGRPTPLYEASRMSDEIGGARIFFKREDLAHTGAHKINNTIGQALLASLMDKRRLIAETGAGQHGVATATVAAHFGMSCRIFMGAEDIRRQAPNVQRMRLLGAEVTPVTSGAGTLKDAMNEAMRNWIRDVADTFYVIGSVAGPHPYPMMVRDFQRVIGEEAREQCLQRWQKMPEMLIACVGGGSNAMGLFHPFLHDREVEMLGVEAAGEGLDSGRHAATLVRGRVGVLHGAKSYLLQDDNGQVLPTHSISAGLDYPGVGPEHSLLKDLRRINYVAVTDRQALEAFSLTTRLEGIIPALESAHAIAAACDIAAGRSREERLVVNLSGRGDKDLAHVSSILENQKGHA